MSDSESDDMPPLEDMTDQFVRSTNTTTKTLGGIITGENSSDLLVNKPKTSSNEPKNTSKTKKSQSSSGFGGFSAGFLSGTQPKKSKPKKSTTQPIIKPKNPQSNLVFDEVQTKMQSLITNNPEKWCNDDLLSKVEKNKTMMSQLDDPEVSKALEWMQRDPKSASEYYTKHRPEIIEMFKSITSLLGNHLVDLDDGKKKKDEILNKPKIRELVKYLKENPDRANYMIRDQNQDTEFKEDVRWLLQNGELKL